MMMTNARILEEWITHLKPEEKEIPIICSTKLSPLPNEKLDPIRIVRHLSPDGTDEFIIICKKGITDD